MGSFWVVSAVRNMTPIPYSIATGITAESTPKKVFITPTANTDLPIHSSAPAIDLQLILP